mmetsp:Transcript_44152/g.138344  ORF Transcript_44152/g.138344 Transcript_44152/m.138344 type:complete len:260 (-) Transcript_44152:490-1269(-)
MLPPAFLLASAQRSAEADDVGLHAQLHHVLQQVQRPLPLTRLLTCPYEGIEGYSVRGDASLRHVVGQCQSELPLLPLPTRADHYAESGAVGSVAHGLDFIKQCQCTLPLPTLPAGAYCGVEGEDARRYSRLRHGVEEGNRGLPAPRLGAGADGRDEAVLLRSRTEVLPHLVQECRGPLPEAALLAGQDCGGEAHVVGRHRGLLHLLEKHESAGPGPSLGTSADQVAVDGSVGCNGSPRHDVQQRNGLLPRALALQHAHH